jgi:hypothetical protein
MMSLLWRAWWQAADFDQFEAERLDLGEHAVECGLVGEQTGQDGPVAPCPGLEGGERGEDRLAQVAADTDPVALRPRVAARTGHVHTTDEAAYLPAAGLAMMSLMVALPGSLGYACELGPWPDERSIARSG